MATKISSKTTGVGGLEVTGDASGVLELASANGTTAVTIDASQNVGIGTTSPVAPLTIQRAGNKGIVLRQNTTADRFQLFVGDGTSGRVADENYISSLNTGLHFLTGASSQLEAMCINSSGNVGIGVTPSAWNTLLGLQIQTTSVASYSNTGYFSSNAYYQSGWKYVATASASQHIQTNGTHQWHIAPSGTAGNAITFTEAMSLDASSNLKFNSGYGSAATAYGCRAWVNFNGQGTVTIRASGNVSSITDHGLGDYTVNFTTAMPDTYYAPVYGMQTFATGGHQGSDNGSCSSYNGTQTASTLRVSNYQGNANSGVDMFMVAVSIFR